MPTVDPGAQTVWSLGRGKRNGPQSVEVRVDVNDDVVEKVKTNNTVFAVLSVPEHYVSVDQAAVSRQRVDVNSTQQIYFHARWSDNGSDTVDGAIYINGAAYVTNSTGWATVNAASPVIVNISWLVTGVDVHGFYAFKQEAPSPWIVWDVLHAYDYGVSKERYRDVNSTQTIWVKIRYAYDGSTFNNSTGSLAIGGQLAEWNEQSVYWAINVSEPIVVQNNYTVPSEF